MALNPKKRRPVFRPEAAPPGSAPVPNLAAELPLPHERDESAEDATAAPDAAMAQAKRDLDAGQVDTDMRATPGLDAELRARLVPGPGGKPPKGHA